LDHTHNNILNSQRAVSNHRLSSESRNTSRRTTRCTLGKSNNRTWLKTTEPRRCQWQSTATTPYNGTGNQTQTAQICSTPDVKPINAAD